MAEDRVQGEAASTANPDEPWLKALRVFVVVSGILLIVGTSALIYLLLNKRESDRAAATARQEAPATAVAVPDGAMIRDVLLENGRALVMLEGADGRDYLLYVDLATGERIGLVVLE